MAVITRGNSLAVVLALEAAFNAFANGDRAEKVEPIDAHVRALLGEPRYAVTFVPGLTGVAFVTYRRRSYYLKYNYAISMWVAHKR